MTFDIERLERIEGKWKRHGIMEYEDVDYVFEQVKRVQELEEEYNVRRVEYLEEHIDRLDRQNKRYREAMESDSE